MARRREKKGSLAAGRRRKVSDVEGGPTTLQLADGGSVALGCATTCGNYTVNLNPTQAAQIARCSARAASQSGGPAGTDDNPFYSGGAAPRCL